MANRLALSSGVAGVVLALCCFTPILAIGLVAAGAGVLVPYIDVVVLPLLALSLAVLVYALVRSRGRTDG